MHAKLSTSLVLLLTLAVGCDKSGSGSTGSTASPADDGPAPTVLDGKPVAGPFASIDEFCGTLAADSCGPDEATSVVMLQSQFAQFTAASETHPLAAVAAQSGSSKTGHLLIQRGDGFWALPALGELAADANLDDDSISITRVTVPDGSPDLVLIGHARLTKQGATRDLTEKTLACRVDAAKPIACAEFTAIRAITDDGANEGLPYLEALFNPVTGSPGVFEVMIIDKENGAASFANEVLGEGRYRFAFP